MTKVADTTAEFEAYEKELDTCTSERRDEIRKTALVCDQLMVYSWEGRYEDREWAALNALVGRVIIKAAGRL